MPRGGHNRKSQAQAKATGTARKDRHVEAAKIAPGTPIKPPGMSDAAAKLWDEYVPLLAEGGVLEQIDGLGLAELFEAAAIARYAREIVGDAVVIEVEDQYGNIRLAKNPGVTVWKDAVATLRGLLADHGMSPLARTRMADATRKPGDAGPDLPAGAPAAWKPKVVKGGGK